MRRKKCDLSVSRSSRDMSKGQSTKKRKKHDNNHGKRARMRKSDLDNLVRGEDAVVITRLLELNHMSLTLYLF